MKILFFISDSDLTPAAMRSLELAGALKADGHEVLLVLRQSALAHDLPAIAAEADGAGIIHAVIRQRMRFDPGLLGQMELILGRFSPDVYVSHDLIGMSFFRMARWRPKRWAVLYDGLWHGRGPLAGFLRLTERRTLRQADLLLAGDGESASALRGWGCKPERIVEGGDGSTEWARRIAAEAVAGALAKR